ncbi:MAG: Rv2231c family pyridoxal phosphate-dependent protein CobC, partial [Mycobacteriales bacterium]
PWLAAEITATIPALGRYPDAGPARAAIAARHGRSPAEVLVTAGAAQAFVLLARALHTHHAVVVHPQFTEPEAALVAAGHQVTRVVLEAPGYLLDPAAIPADADLVVVGNPTNPTSVLHPAASLAALARPGRVLVVDEAFMDAVPGESASLAGRADLPGLVVVRSLTKTWGLAGLRVGYLLAAPDLVRRLAAAAPLWPVSAPGLAAARATARPGALAEAAAWAARLAEERAGFAAALGTLPGVEVTPGAAAPFLLLRVPDGPRLRTALRAGGLAVRRGDTFPGLGPHHLRVSARAEREANEEVVASFYRCLLGETTGAPA